MLAVSSVHTIVVIQVLVMCIKVVYGNACTEKAAKYSYPVLTMCEATSWSGRDVVIDTFESSLRGTDSCNCSVTALSSSAFPTQLTLRSLSNLQPGGRGCGSSIEFSKGAATIVRECDLTSSTIFVHNGDVVSIKWTIDADSSNSKYCAKLRLTPGYGYSMSVTCTAAGTAVQTQLTSELPVTTVEYSTSTNNENRTSSTLKSSADTSADATDDSPVAISVSVGVVLIAVALAIITIMYIRKKRRQSDLPTEYETYNPRSHNHVNMSYQYTDFSEPGMEQFHNSGTPNYQNVLPNETTLRNGLKVDPNNQYEDVQIPKDQTTGHTNKPRQANEVLDKQKGFKNGKHDETVYDNPRRVYVNVVASGGISRLPQ